MAEFSRLVITGKGQALLAKMIEGSGSVEFTRISSSSEEYTDDQLEGLESLSNIKQTSLISKVTRTNEVAIKVEAAFTNTELTSGYYIKTLGLYASDPDDGEILYAVTRETSGGCYMPAYNGATVSGAYVQLVTTVGNAENVSLEVDPAAVATIGDIKGLQEQVADQAAAIEEAKTAANEAKKEVEGIAKNTWLVSDAESPRKLTILTEGSSEAVPSDLENAYVLDAEYALKLINAGKESSREGWLITITIPEYLAATGFRVAPVSLKSTGLIGKIPITVSFIMPTDAGEYSFTSGAEFVLYNSMGADIGATIGTLHVNASQTFGVPGMKPRVTVAVSAYDHSEGSIKQGTVSVPDENIRIEHL